MFKVLYQRLEDGKKNQSTFFSDLSRFKYNRYCNDILFFTDYSDLLFLTLSKNQVPSSTLALTQVFFFLTYSPYLNMN